MSDQSTGTDQKTAAPRRPLRRRNEGRIVAGVAAGVAEHIGVDVVIVRILFVITTIFTNGLGLLAYVLGWIFIPADDGEPAPDDATSRTGAARARDTTGWSRDPLFWVGVGLLILGAVWLLDGPIGPTRWFPTLFDRGLVWPLVLIGFGIALWRAGERRGEPAGAPAAAVAPPTAPPPASATGPTVQTPPSAPTAPSTQTTPGQTPGSETTMPASRPETTELPRDAVPGEHEPTVPIGPGGPGQPPRPPADEPRGGQPAWTPPPVPDRPRSLLGRLTLGLALVAAGVMWLLPLLLQAVGAPRVLPLIGLSPIGVARVAAAALLVVGIGLLVGSVRGRARWLVIVGLVLAPVVIAAELARPIGLAALPGTIARGPVGEIHEAPATAAAIQPRYELGAGQLHLDLSDVDLVADTSIRVEVGAGQIIITVPDEVDVEVTARAGAGDIDLFGQRSGGLGVTRSVSSLGDGEVGLELQIDVGFGEVRVRRAGPVEGAGVPLERPDPPSARIEPAPLAPAA